MFETVKTHKWKLLVSSVIILLPVLAGVLLWDRLPERMAIHWGFNGEPDGWASRDLAVFGLPVFMLVLNWVCLLVEKRNFTFNPKPMALVFFICPVVSVVCGALMLASVLLPGKAGSAALLVLALAACILPVAYSWRYARRQG